MKRKLIEMPQYCPHCYTTPKPLQTFCLFISSIDVTTWIYKLNNDHIDSII
jgi:hypothetical protein